MNKYEDTYQFQDVKIPMKNLDKIEFLIAKFNSSAVIDWENKMYFWGDYYDGFKIKTPEFIYDFEDKLIDISFGLKHALALLDTGKVYSWGDGTYGELGQGRYYMINEPKEIKFFSEENIQVVKVEAGSWHSIVLDTLGWLWGFGVSSSDSRFEVWTNIPKLVDMIKFKSIDVFVGDNHSVAVSKNGVPY